MHADHGGPDIDTAVGCNGFNDDRIGVIKNENMVVDVSDTVSARKAKGPQRVMEEIIEGWRKYRKRFEKVLAAESGVPLSTSVRSAREPQRGQNFCPTNIIPKHDGHATVARRAPQCSHRVASVDARPGMLQLRVATQLSLPSVLWNLPSIWSGEFAHENLLDFHAERVTVQFERPMPLQIGGDAEGWRESVVFGMAPGGVEMVDFRSRRPRLLN